MEVIGRQILLYYFVVVFNHPYYLLDCCENSVEIIFVGDLTQCPINVAYCYFYQDIFKGSVLINGKNKIWFNLKEIISKQWNYEDVPIM